MYQNGIQTEPISPRTRPQHQIRDSTDQFSPFQKNRKKTTYLGRIGNIMLNEKRRESVCSNGYDKNYDDVTSSDADRSRQTASAVSQEKKYQGQHTRNYHQNHVEHIQNLNQTQTTLGSMGKHALGISNLSPTRDQQVPFSINGTKTVKNPRQGIIQFKKSSIHDNDGSNYHVKLRNIDYASNLMDQIDSPQKQFKMESPMQQTSDYYNSHARHNTTFISQSAKRAPDDFLCGEFSVLDVNLDSMKHFHTPKKRFERFQIGNGTMNKPNILIKKTPQKQHNLNLNDTSFPNRYESVAFKIKDPVKPKQNLGRITMNFNKPKINDNNNSKKKEQFIDWDDELFSLNKPDPKPPQATIESKCTTINQTPALDNDYDNLNNCSWAYKGEMKKNLIAFDPEEDQQLVTQISKLSFNAATKKNGIGNEPEQDQLLVSQESKTSFAKYENELELVLKQTSNKKPNDEFYSSQKCTIPYMGLTRDMLPPPAVFQEAQNYDVSTPQQAQMSIQHSNKKMLPPPAIFQDTSNQIVDEIHSPHTQVTITPHQDPDFEMQPPPAIFQDISNLILEDVDDTQDQVESFQVTNQEILPPQAIFQETSNQIVDVVQSSHITDLPYQDKDKNVKPIPSAIHRKVNDYSEEQQSKMEILDLTNLDETMRLSFFVQEQMEMISPSESQARFNQELRFEAEEEPSSSMKQKKKKKVSQAIISFKDSESFSEQTSDYNSDSDGSQSSQNNLDFYKQNIHQEFNNQLLKASQRPNSRANIARDSNNFKKLQVKNNKSLKHHAKGEMQIRKDLHKIIQERMSKIVKNE